MSIFTKLKNVKKKWIIITAIILVVLIAGGITASVLHENFEHRDGGHKNSNEYQVYSNLLYLENTDALKLTSEQAKALLPLVQKLPNTNSTTQPGVLKSIYEQLTPQQYYTLFTGTNNYVGEKGHGKMGRGGFGGMRGFAPERNKTSVMSDTLKDVVIKMLKDKSQSAQ
ncbi:MAG: hypothetical protein Q8920_13325 [Bacillota bacterium]|nr:hypothetical protein [Bacillota bacterium]